MEGVGDCDFLTDNVEDFYKVAKASTKCALFADEAGEMFGKNKEAIWLTTRARHNGHNSHIMAHRVNDINKTMRSQCTHHFYFNLPHDDAKVLAQSLHPDLINVKNLRKGHFMYWRRFDSDGVTFIPKHGKVWWAK